MASRSHRTPETDAFLANYPVTEFRSIGSSLKFCLVAAGEADIYPRIGTTMEWDTAAGHAVLHGRGRPRHRARGRAVPLRQAGIPQRQLSSRGAADVVSLARPRAPPTTHG